jgi:VanZ family protein
MAVGLTMLAGAGDEFHQSFLPFREARLSDVLLDTVAATICALIMSALAQRTASR